MRKPAIAYISTFPPTQCGIATYTSDLSLQFHTQYPHILLIKVEITFDNESCNNRLSRNPNYFYSEDSIKNLNNRENTVFHLQHEFKLFGGQHGEEVIELLSNFKKPLVTTLHTVRDETNKTRQQIIEAIVRNSKLLYVFTESAKRDISERYFVNSEKINVIPHGVPEVPFSKPEHSVMRRQINTKILFISAGHFRETKGIETSLYALGKLKRTFRNFKYLIVGSDHPRNSGSQSYRLVINELIEELGLKEHIIFIDKYLPIDQLIKCIQASDIGLVPYTRKDQSSSGILSLFMACSRPVITSNFQYAVSIIKNENGLIVEATDNESLYSAIHKLVLDRTTRENMMDSNFQKTRTWCWSKVAEKYFEDINKLF
jgi:glycosyltransferase involved in cell wall biosynthesis